MHLDLRRLPRSGCSKYSTARPSVTHTIFHDASAFSAPVQVLTKSQVQDVMWGKCVIIHACSHTVSYKVVSTPLTEIFTIIDAWCNSLIRTPSSSSIRQEKNYHLFGLKAISPLLCLSFFFFFFTCTLDIWPGCTVRCFRTFTLLSVKHEWGVEYLMPNPHHSTAHTLLTKPQVTHSEETQLDSRISIFADRTEFC